MTNEEFKEYKELNEWNTQVAESRPTLTAAQVEFVKTVSDLDHCLRLQYCDTAIAREVERAINCAIPAMNDYYVKLLYIPSPPDDISRTFITDLFNCSYFNGVGLNRSITKFGSKRLTNFLETITSAGDDRTDFAEASGFYICGFFGMLHAVGIIKDSAPKIKAVHAFVLSVVKETKESGQYLLQKH